WRKVGPERQEHSAMRNTTRAPIRTFTCTRTSSPPPPEHPVEIF
ncbi:2540_t:CDS:1, partial [Ambispora gerdemannii]